ncbi:protein of unknown function [Methylacidimicrobium sp. AP8]|nr:protein of unknown function [Methylacidimicrobium sp. AP8]
MRPSMRDENGEAAPEKQACRPTCLVPAAVLGGRRRDRLRGARIDLCLGASGAVSAGAGSPSPPHARGAE